MTAGAAGARLVTLCLHGVGRPPAHVDHVEDWYWCDLDVFRALLDGIVLAQDAGRVRVRLTFDDGNASDLSVVVPELRQRGLSAMFFVCTGRLRVGDAYLSEADLRILVAEGMEIGCHGRDHLRLREVSDAVLRAETTGAQAVLQHVLGAPVTEYALPYGNYDARVIRALADFSRIHTTDAISGRTRDRLVHRYCYSRSWQSDDLTRLAGDHPRRLRNARTWARLALKRNRPGRRVG